METIALVRKFLAAIGIGLVAASLVSIWSDPVIVRAGGHEFDYETGSRYLLITLVAIAAVILLASVMLERDRFLGTAAGLGAIIWGFYAFIPFSFGFGNLSDLEFGSWLGLGGSALIVAALVPVETLVSKELTAKGRDVSIWLSWLTGMIGLGLVIVAIPRPLREELAPIVGRLETRTYWNSAGVPSGGHTLGVAMIVLASLAATCAVLTVVTRMKMLQGWAVGFSLILLGVVLYIPSTLAIDSFVDLRPGAGLALEGALLGAAGMSAAALASRRAIELGWPALRKLVILVGLGLALAGTWTDTFSSGGGSLWADTTLGGFVSLLLLVAAAMLVASFFIRRSCLVQTASLLGWLIAGYFGFYLIQALPSFGRIGTGVWLGVAGGALAGVGLVSPKLLTSWRPRALAFNSRRAFAGVAAAAGLGLVIVSLWLDLESKVELKGGGVIGGSYWDFNNDHSLGIGMLALVALGLIAIAGSLLTRIAFLEALAAASALVLLGVAVFLPAFEAFNRLGELKAGAYLALVGALVAAAGAVAIALLDKPLESLRPEEQLSAEEKKGSSARPRGRRAAKGRVPGTRSKK